MFQSRSDQFLGNFFRFSFLRILSIAYSSFVKWTIRIDTFSDITPIICINIYYTHLLIVDHETIPNHTTNEEKCLSQWKKMGKKVTTVYLHFFTRASLSVLSSLFFLFFCQQIHTHTYDVFLLLEHSNKQQHPTKWIKRKQKQINSC